MACQNNGTTLTAVVRTSHGAFLGIHPPPNDSGLTELRTFIGLHQMGDRQKVLSETLRAAHEANPIDAHLGNFMRPNHPLRGEAVSACHQALLNTSATHWPAMRTFSAPRC